MDQEERAPSLLYVREVDTYGEVRIRTREEADAYLLTDKFKVENLAILGKKGSLGHFVQSKLNDVRRMIPPRDEDNRRSTVFHQALKNLDEKCNWLNDYQTREQGWYLLGCRTST